MFSTGVSARFNVLGSFVFEMFYVYPFQRPAKGGHPRNQLQVIGQKQGPEW